MAVRSPVVAPPALHVPDCQRSPGLSSLLWAMVLVGLGTVAFSVTSNAFAHWFVLPVTLCGILIGRDAVDWVRGRRDVFHPFGIVGLLGLFFFYGAPMLHVATDEWMLTPNPPDDWRPWLGGMAVLNAMGILIYQAVRHVRVRPRIPRPAAPGRRLVPRRFARVMALAMVVSVALQLMVYASYGGIGGYIATYEDRYGDGGFAGMGLLFTFSEAFPLLVVIAYAVRARARGIRPGWVQIGGVLVACLVLQLFFGGLRGSRSNTIWALFMAVGILHLWVRPITRKLVLLGIVVLIAFMTLYGFYKTYGAEVVDAYRSSGSIGQLTEDSGRGGLTTTALRDLARSDVQALLLARLLPEAPTIDYRHAWGGTYVQALALPIPDGLWRDRPPSKAEAGTMLMIGESWFRGDVSSRVYGLAGEAMLNFGPLAVPLAFIPYGLFVGWVARRYETLDRADARSLLLPLLVILTFTTLSADLNNIVFFVIKNGLVPFLVLWIGSRAVSRPSPAATRTVQTPVT